MPQNGQGGGSGPKRPGSGMFDQDEESITKARLKKAGLFKQPAAPPPRPAPPQAGQPAAAAPRPTVPMRPAGPPPKIAVNARGLITIKGGQLQTATEKRLARSRFENNRSFERLSGGMPVVHTDDDEVSVSVSVTAPAARYDGETPAQEVTSTDLWRALQAPAQSRENRRDKELYRNVINQFAAGTNPRYAPEAPDKLRSHIFVWDVSRAMNAELPHFVGGKEMSLGQTVDWLRLEGPMHGWRKLAAAEAIERAMNGYPVIAVPKDPKSKAMAVVRPSPRGPDGQPRFASAGKKRGNDLGLFEALGAFAAEYFVHP